MKTYHYIVIGRVQGVAFRYYTQKAARDYGIKGTVANLANGHVEVFAQGSEAQIALFEEFLHNGPRFARVDRVEREILDDKHVFGDFQVTFR